MLDNREAGAPQRFTSIICVCAVGEPASWIMAYALKRAKEKVTIVVGDDTDLLVLLCYVGSNILHDILLIPSHPSIAIKLENRLHQADI